MLAMFAQHERENTIERIRASSKKSKGSFGRILDAKDANKTSVLKRRNLAKSWAEQSGIIEEIKEAKSLLRKPTYKSVCLFLNGKGLVSRSGKEFSPGGLQRLIQRLGFKNLQVL